MFYYSYLMFKKDKKHTVDDYYQIFIYGVVFYIAFFIIINTDLVHDNFFNNFIKDYILYIMVLDGGYLIYEYINLKQSTEKKKEIDSDTDSDTTEKIDLNLDLDSDNDIKISHQSSDTSSILISDIQI